jgi:predicted house-cleaning noncanonical NTP pyrophosphatase (MazG superfamily)
MRQAADIIEDLAHLVTLHEGARDDYGWDKINALLEEAQEFVKSERAPKPYWHVR